MTVQLRAGHPFARLGDGTVTHRIAFRITCLQYNRVQHLTFYGFAAVQSHTWSQLVRLDDDIVSYNTFSYGLEMVQSRAVFHLVRFGDSTVRCTVSPSSA